MCNDVGKKIRRLHGFTNRYLEHAINCCLPCKVTSLFFSFAEISGEKGRDVFGHVPMKKQLECVCPNCSRNLAASRFAPHLEKCMGMGRNSSRIASRR